MRFRLVSSLSIPLLLAHAAIAQPLDPAAPGDRARLSPADEIVVTGRRDGKESTHSFVETVTVETNDQIAKFWNEVCPAVYGLPSAQAGVVVGRLREVARLSGLPLAERQCDANVIIVVADDALDFVGMMRKERRLAFNGLDLSLIRTLVEGDRPVRSWHTVELRGADGRRLQRVQFIEGIGYCGGCVIVPGVQPSRIQKSVRQDLALAFVVFDLSAIDGLSLGQIADYAAMRAFARTDSDASTPSGQSVLSLFDPDGGEPVDGLTEWDAAYLRALYATGNTVSASLQQSNMARILREELDKPEMPPREHLN